MQAWVAALAEVLAPSTVEVVVRHVSSVFKAAVLDRLIPSSPTQGIKLPKKEPREIVPLDVEQVRAIADAIQPRYGALVVLMAATGIRPGEAFGLSNDRVDWLQRSIRVDRQLVTVGNVAQFGPPKTAASHRVIPVPDFILQRLSAHVREHPPGVHGLLFTNAKEEICLLYTSPSPRDATLSRMPSSA